MKLPPWLTGKRDEPAAAPLPPPLPEVDTRRLAQEQRAAEEAEKRAQVRADRQEKPGPAGRLEKGYPSDQLKTEGPKPGTQPPAQVEKVPTQLRNDPTPQQKPDVQTPGSDVKWVTHPTPTGSRVVSQPKPPPSSRPEEKRPSFEQALKTSTEDRSTPGGDDIGGR